MVPGTAPPSKNISDLQAAAFRVAGGHLPHRTASLRRTRFIAKASFILARRSSRLSAHAPRARCVHGRLEGGNLYPRRLNLDSLSLRPSSGARSVHQRRPRSQPPFRVLRGWPTGWPWHGHRPLASKPTVTAESWRRHGVLGILPGRRWTGRPPLPPTPDFRPIRRPEKHVYLPCRPRQAYLPLLLTRGTCVQN